MKTISQYKEDIKNLMAKAADIDTKCIAENRDPNETEITLKNELLDAVDDFKKIINVQERQERIGDLLDKPEPNKTVPTGRVEVDDDNRSKEKFNSFGEQLGAIRNAALPGRTFDPRLHNAATGLGTTVPSDGGFAIQPNFSTEMLKQVFETGLLASKPTRRVKLTNSNSTIINGVDETSRANGSRHGGVVVYWIDEGTSITPSKPKFRRIEVKLKKAAGLVYLTDEALEDAAVLESECGSAFVSEMGFAVDDGMVNGVGAGKMVGCLHSGSLVSVTKETGQKAATLMAQNVIKMYSRMFASSLSSAEWYINQALFPQLLTMSLAVGLGGVPVYLPPGNSLTNAPGGALLGRPVNVIEQCQAPGTAGDIIFADYKNGYYIADKGGIKTDMSIHVEFLTDQACFRYILRIDGQPIRETALTPYKGGSSATQSHFIVTATRD